MWHRIVPQSLLVGPLQALQLPASLRVATRLSPLLSALRNDQPLQVCSPQLTESARASLLCLEEHWPTESPGDGGKCLSHASSDVPRLTLGSFYINLPLNGVAATIILLTLKTPKISRHEEDANAPWLEKLQQLDLPGTFIIMAAVICFLLPMQWGGVTKNWNSADVVGTLVGFCLITIAFLVVEYLQSDRALLLFYILKKRVVYVGCIVSFL